MRTTPLWKSIPVRDRYGQVVGQKDVALYPGLLSKAHEEGLKRITTKILQLPDDENGHTAVVFAEVETSKGVFTGIGDANPEHVNAGISRHLIRMAETRAKARALRDAVNIGMVALEELGGGETGSEDDVSVSAESPTVLPPSPQPRGNGHATPSTDDDRPWSENQRRYLYRLLAGQGLEGEAARHRLQQVLGMTELHQVTRAQASRAIDVLKANGASSDAPHDGGAR